MAVDVPDDMGDSPKKQDVSRKEMNSMPVLCIQLSTLSVNSIGGVLG